jgi:hypothetical protein
MASKSARRRRAMSNSQVPYARMRPNVTNWGVGGSATDGTGSVIGGTATPTGPATWQNGTTAFPLLSGQQVSYQAVVVVPAANLGTPGIGRLKIDEIKGRIYCTPTQSHTTPPRVTVGVGIYVSEYTISTTKWSVHDPLVTADAAVDDYFFLEVQEKIMPCLGALNVTADSWMYFDLHLANPLIIGGGQALHVTVSVITAAGGFGVNVASAFRTRTGPVA